VLEFSHFRLVVSLSVKSDETIFSMEYLVPSRLPLEGTGLYTDLLGRNR
jgi:hypothetical protein